MKEDSAQERKTMLFRRDVENDGSWWVDEGLDNKATQFAPCELCEATMAAREVEDRVWQEFKLCYECNTQLELLNAIAEVQDERPYNLDRELGRITDESPDPS
jgi:hypothetical protein